MQPARWDDPVGSACAEAALSIRRGLRARPTLYGFEDGQPVLRAQAGLAFLHDTQLDLRAAMCALLPLFGIRQALLFGDVRLTDDEVEDPTLRDALATFGLMVEIAELRGDKVHLDVRMLDYQWSSDEVTWDRPIELSEGMWSAALEAFLPMDRDDLASGGQLAGLLYGYSRQGMVVEVAPGMRSRFGLDRLAPSTVRREDRRRARDLGRSARTPGSQRPPRTRDRRDSGDARRSDGKAGRDPGGRRPAHGRGPGEVGRRVRRVER